MWGVTSGPVSVYSSPTWDVITIRSSNGHGLVAGLIIHRSRMAEDSTPMPYDSIVATVLTMLVTPRLGIVHVANLAGRVLRRASHKRGYTQSKSSKLIPPPTQGSQS